MNEQLRPIGVVPDFAVNPEPQEVDESIVARWFAGALEAGGVISFGIQRKPDEPTKAYPYIAFYDANEGFINGLKQRFGGSVPPTKPHEWRLSGYKAAEIIASTEPYTVTRREAAVATRNWLEADREERVRIAEEMKGYDRLQDGSIEQYRHLVTDGAFTAGILDNRGSYYRFAENPRVEINTTNHLLLLALQERYGGNLDVRVKAGTKIKIGGKEFTTKRDTYSLTIADNQARAFVSNAAPALQISPPDEWGMKIVKESTRERINQIEDMGEFAIKELERYKKGEIFHISTAQEIANRFDTSFQTTRRRLLRLPDEIRKERESILRTTNRCVLTEEETRAIISVIVQELHEFLGGTRDRLTTNREWEERLNVGRGVINKLTAHIPADVRVLRTQINNSLTTIERNEKYGNPSSKKS